jgi:hypothetical protein
METLYYKIVDNGYHIYDYNNEFFHIYQYEPFISNKTKSYEENAQEQIREIYTERYASKVYGGVMTIDEVPEEYSEAVMALVERYRATEGDPEPPLTEMEQKAKAYDILMGVSE